MTDQETLKELFEKLDEIEACRRCMSRVHFDMYCCAPPDGLALAGADAAFLGKRLFELTHDQAYLSLLLQLRREGRSLSPMQRRAVERLAEDYEKEKNLTAAFSFERDMALSRAYSDWMAAKQAKDFSLFRDSFSAVVEYTRRSIQLRDRAYPSVYDACLDDYEKNGSIQRMDPFFEALRQRITPLLKRIRESGKIIRADFLDRPCPIRRQEAMSRYLLRAEGLRESALVLMTTEHPFTEGFGPDDVRVTTHYYEGNFISNIFSTLHEGGHALVMQNEPRSCWENHCYDRASAAMHETISRFYENLIGRSEAFIRFVYPKLRELSGDLFADVSPRELYEAVNLVRPGLIRTEADELSYGLHVLIRYELEKAAVNGELAPEQLPARWNALTRELLGVEVPSDDLGCLQDVHWTDGFGYFPSYALGSAYGVQILRTMQRDFDVYAAVEAGRLEKVTDWLRERVFPLMSLADPDEWIAAITGEALNVNYYLDYLEEKFSSLYEL